MKHPYRYRPGTQWRILAHDGERRIELENEGVFDEVVIDHWLHLEQMGDRECLLAVGDGPEVAILIDVKDDGAVALRLEIPLHYAEAKLNPTTGGYDVFPRTGPSSP